MKTGEGSDSDPDRVAAMDDDPLLQELVPRVLDDAPGPPRLHPLLLRRHSEEPYRLGRTPLSPVCPDRPRVPPGAWVSVVVL